MKNNKNLIATGLLFLLIDVGFVFASVIPDPPKHIRPKVNVATLAIRADSRPRAIAANRPAVMRVAR